MIVWRRRLVRLHLEGSAPSLEGVLVGIWAGHYILRLPKIIPAVGESHPLDGNNIKVPRERVIFVQELR